MPGAKKPPATAEPRGPRRRRCLCTQRPAASPAPPARRPASRAAPLLNAPAAQESGVWAVIRTIHRAAHLTIAVSPKAASDLIAAGAVDPKSVKVGWAPPH
jgi:hypothetical protein